MFNCCRKPKYCDSEDERLNTRYVETKSIHECDADKIITYKQPDMLVYSHNLFDYTNMRWSNVVENTYWNGMFYYTVRLVV